MHGALNRVAFHPQLNKGRLLRHFNVETTAVKVQPSPLPSGAQGIVVAIGAEDDLDWPPETRKVLAAHRVVHVPWPRLTGAYLGTLSPDTVVTPLMGARFDALEVATWLGGNDYDGRLVVVVRHALPNARLVRDEIAAAGRGLRVDILVCD